MRRFKARGLILLLATGLALLAAASGHAAEGSSGSQRLLLFRDIRLFDGERVRDGVSVLVENDLILQVARRISPPREAQIIDGDGFTLLPGLFDSHTHVYHAESLSASIAFGVTTNLDMFTPHVMAARYRREQKLGQASDRADIHSAGTLVTAPGGHGTQYGVPIPTLAAPAEAQQFIADRIAEGSDFIKIVYEDGSALGLQLPTLDRATMRAAVSAAHDQGKMAVVHVTARERAREALAAGVDGLVHQYVDAEADDEIIKLMVKRKAFVIPTLAVVEGLSEQQGGRPVLVDEYLSPYLSAVARQTLERRFPPRESSPARYENAEKTVRRLHAAGVPILAGSDAPNPGTWYGASLHREMELLVAAGLTPVEALAAATSVPASTFGLNDRGRVAAGKRADLVLVKGDPTTDIRASRNIVSVWKEGVRAQRPPLAPGTEARVAASDTPANPNVAAAGTTDGATAEATVAGAGDAGGTTRGLVSTFDENTDTGFGAGWETSVDSFVGGKSTATLERVAGGAAGSAGSLKVTGEIEDRSPPRWGGAIFYPGDGPMRPADLSRFTGIRFWARGDGQTFLVMLFSSSLGFQPAVVPFEPGKEWQEFSFSIADFAGVDSAGITGLYLGAGTETGPYELHIDEVSFR